MSKHNRQPGKPGNTGGTVKTVTPSTTEAPKPKAVEAAPKQKAPAVKKTVALPPKPEVVIGDVPNPILDSKRNKRPLAVAFAKVLASVGKKPEEHVPALADLMRRTGIVKRLGFTADTAAEATNLANSELSGVGYAQRTAVAFFKSGYCEQYPEKVKACEPFARAALKAYHPELLAKA